MRRRTTLAILLAATTLAATAQAAPKIGTQGNGYSLADERYLSLYEQAHKAGYDVGRNLLDWTWSDAKSVSDARIEASSERLSNWLNPPSSPTAPVETASYGPPVPVTSSGGVSNATVQCESGGDYSINTGNGYYGGYQFDSQTWDAYGDPAYGEANEAPPAVQDQAAANVPYDAWPNC